MNHATFRKVSIVAALMLAAAACGSDSDSSSGSTEPTAASTESSEVETAGEDTSSAEATEVGEPLQIGYVNQEDGAGSTFPDLRSGTEAAVSYVNANGGIHGRPLELVDCSTDGSPEASQACANEMIAAGVPIVSAGIDYGSPAALPVLEAAGISYMPTLPTINEEYVSPNVYTFFGGSAGQFAGQVGYIMSEYAPTKVGVLVINVPQGVGAAELLVKAPLEAQGVEVNIVPADPTTADFTPSLTALMRDEPDVLSVLFTGPPCGSIMQAVGALGIDIPVLYPSGCVDKEFLQAGGAGANGAIFSVESEPLEAKADDPDVQLYVGAMSEFAAIDADDLTTYNQVAFTMTYNLAQALKRVDGDVTSASVVEALTSAGPHDSLMAPDYTCDGSALPGFTTLCNASVKFVQYQDGALIELTPEWS